MTTLLIKPIKRFYFLINKGPSGGYTKSGLISLKSLLVPKLRDVEFLKTNPTKTKIYIKVRLESE